MSCHFNPDKFIQDTQNTTSVLFEKSKIKDNELIASAIALEKLTALTFLSCPNLTVEIMPLLGRCTLLQSLTLEGMPAAVTNQSIHHLSNLTNLTALYLPQQRYLTSEGLKITSHLNELIVLDLSGCVNLKLELLSPLTWLQALNLKGINTLIAEDLKPLPKSLSTLNLTGTEVGLNHITSLTNLTFLDLSNIKGKSQKLIHLTALIQLKMLNCGGNDVSMIEGGMEQLGKLTRLEALFLPHFTDEVIEEVTLQELSPLTKLKSLDLSHLRIKKCGPILDFTRLIMLSLSHSPLLTDRQVKPLANLPNLTYLDLFRKERWEDADALENLFSSIKTLKINNFKVVRCDQRVTSTS